MDASELALEPYFERIDYQETPRADRRTLFALHEAHLAAIPFENLDILLGKPISLELAALERKLVSERRGGYCFEQNSLFRAVLEALDFPVDSLAARVRVGTRAIRPRTHMLLRVETDEGAFLVDVGFGGDGPLLPLPLKGPPGETHRLKREEELFVLEGRIADRGDFEELYAFTLEPHYPADFEMANHFTSTYPRSPFVQSLTAQRSRRSGRAILRNRELQRISEGTIERETIRDPEHLLEVLAREFDLRFPPGTRFSKPDF